MSVQPGGAGTDVTCPACAHVYVCPWNADDAVLNCDECGVRIAYGVLMPRVAHLPHAEDKRFVVMRVETVKDGQPVLVQLTFDRELGGRIARDLLSVCP